MVGVWLLSSFYPVWSLWEAGHVVITEVESHVRR